MTDGRMEVIAAICTVFDSQICFVLLIVAGVFFISLVAIKHIFVNVDGYKILHNLLLVSVGCVFLADNRWLKKEVIAELALF